MRYRIQHHNLFPSTYACINVSCSVSDRLSCETHYIVAMTFEVDAFQITFNPYRDSINDSVGHFLYILLAIIVKHSVSSNQ